jgi:hypothetical protein
VVQLLIVNPGVLTKEVVMTWQEIAQAASKLSDSDKLKVIEAIVHTFPGGDAAKEVPATYEVAAHPVEEDENVREERLDKWIEQRTQTQDIAALIQELLSRPNPTPDQMLPRGILRGINFTDEDFKAAEWHPTDEELENAGLSLRSLRG